MESLSNPQLPVVVLTKVVAMLQRDENEQTYAFKDRLRLAAVNRQLREVVLTATQQRQRRMMWIRTNNLTININGLIVKRGSAYSQMDCIDALLAFAQPNALIVVMYSDWPLWNQTICHIFTTLTLTYLDVSFVTEAIRVDSTLEKTFKAIGSLVNMEVFRICVRTYRRGGSATAYLNSSPSVPADSLFKHLLTLKNLRALRIEADELISMAQMTNLLNRSPSKISHICCNFEYEYLNRLLIKMDDGARGNITGLCCVLHSCIVSWLARLPNCRVIHYRWWLDSVSRKSLDTVGHKLLDICHAADAHRGRILECNIDVCDRLPQYMEQGGQSVIEYTRDDTIVRLSIGSEEMMKQKNCIFSRHYPHQGERGD